MGQDICPRCGFKFPKEVRSDVRDRVILERHDGQAVESVKRDLRDKLTQLISHFENLELSDSSVKDTPPFLEEALGTLHVPVAIVIGDELRFSERQKKLIMLLVSKLKDAELHSGIPIASTRSYVRLANALHCLGEADDAMEMMDKALFKEPADPDALFGKAKLLFYEKRYDEAERHLNRLMTKAKKNPDAIYLAEIIGQLKIKK